MNVLRLDDNVCLLELPSELTDPDERPYSNACAPQSSAHNRYLILDFSAVQIINGFGATMLVKFSTLARRCGQRLLAQPNSVGRGRLGKIKEPAKPVVHSGWPSSGRGVRLSPVSTKKIDNASPLRLASFIWTRL